MTDEEIKVVVEEVVEEEEVVDGEEVLVDDEDEIVVEEEEKVVEEDEETVDVPVAEVTQAKVYMGKDIISERIVVVNEKEYHSLTLVDGSVQQLTDAEYIEGVK